MENLTYTPDKKTLTDKQLIEELKRELKEVRIQRNEYEQELIKARNLIGFLKHDNECLEYYINSKKK